MTREELLAVLDDMRARIELGDSFEGGINYLMPWAEELGDPVTDPPDGFRVEGGYRVGNRMGQGGFRMIGTIT